MGVFRIYPEKNNTIASGVYSGFNAGQNAVTDLWYGGGGTDTSPHKRNSFSRIFGDDNRAVLRQPAFFYICQLFGRLASAGI